VNIPPPDLDEVQLVSELAAGWDVVVDAVCYLPQGFGSFHWLAETAARGRLFVTVDDLDDKPWLGSDRDTVYAALRSCFEVAVTLHDGAGLAFVLAPLPDGTGGAVRRMTDRYSLAAFPFMDGGSGRWGEPVSDGSRTEVLERLAALHGATPAVANMLRHRGWALPGRNELEEALDDLERQWGSGPFGEPARALMGEHREEILQWLSEYDGLAGVLADVGADLVVTHGEPHPGNWLRAGSRLYLIDWDTIALAPRERDLWMLAGHPRALDRYVDVTGQVPDPRALAFFRLMWRLQDLAAFIGVLRAPHADDPDVRKAWRGVGDYLLERVTLPWV
jgi:spectinomycin phosphotransferase